MTIVITSTLNLVSCCPDWCRLQQCSLYACLCFDVERCTGSETPNTRVQRMLCSKVPLFITSFLFRCAETQPQALQDASLDARAAWAHSTMRCRGCAAKVSPGILQRVLQSLSSTSCPTQALNTASSSLKSVVSGQLDDAVVLQPPPEGCVSVQTVDFINSFVDDPFVFGGIVALHAMSDCFAMGAEPAVALAVVQVRFRCGLAQLLCTCFAHVMHSCFAHAMHMLCTCYAVMHMFCTSYALSPAPQIVWPSRFQ
jgi:hypothetical protein